MADDGPEGFHFASLFEQVARRVPEREAVVQHDARLTFAELNDAADAVAQCLVDCSVAAGDRVGVGSTNRWEMLAALIGICKAAAIPFALNPRYTPPEIRHIIDDCDPALVIADARTAQRLADAGFAAVWDIDVHPIVWDTDSQPIASDTDVQPISHARQTDAVATHEARTRRDSDLFLIYTGGTTGTPRGVAWTHRDLFFGALGGGRPGGPAIETPAELSGAVVSRSVRLAVASPLVHGTAQWGALGALLTGATVVIDNAESFDARRLLRLLATEHVAYLTIVGDAFAQPLCDELAAHPGDYDLDALTVVLSGGAPLTPSYAARLSELLPGAVIVDGFGASETGGFGNAVCSATRVETTFVLDESSAVLGDDGAPVAIGESGRLARRGPIPQGYWNDPHNTGKRFWDIAGQRWALSGDRAVRVDATTVRLLGREDRCITTGGEKVDADEVERALCSLDGVDAALVVGIPHARFGHAVAAVLVATSGPTNTDAGNSGPGNTGPAVSKSGLRPARSAGQLAAELASSLAEYKVPRHVVYVDALRYTPEGKPDYTWARDLLMADAT